MLIHLLYSLGTYINIINNLANSNIPRGLTEEHAIAYKEVKSSLFLCASLP
jgi:hypothetical protein